jgi:hydroxymethylpyrimidine kinase/phosphomethylpyrimidine kinase/thiamine-phosphate diphosphorylase
VLQYRAKVDSHEEKLRAGGELKRLCTEFGVTFIVNDDLQLARTLDADGLHLGQEDGDPVEARMILGSGKIIGVSTHNLTEARRAEAAGADYIGFGAMYPTASKEIRHLPGPGALAEIKAAIGIPVAAIGGITSENASALIDAGADAIAVISAVLSDRTPGVAAAELALAFNRRTGYPRGTVLSIAGSDSGGGAGIQADIKTITLFGGYAASVITAVTAQNSCGVSAVYGIPPAIVAEQLAAVLSDIPVDVIKTGMLFSGELTALVADKLRAFNRRIVVVDPVLTAKGGATLLDRQARSIFREQLFPVTYLLTPNIPEAEWLTGLTIRSVTEMEEAARLLHSMGVRNVLIKGGHLADGDAVDILFNGNVVTRFAAPRLDTKNSHGTGCTYASAIAALLAQGVPLAPAVSQAKEFVTRAIRFAHPLGSGHGPVNHFMAAREKGTRDQG